MSVNDILSGNFILDPESVNDTGSNVATMFATADGAIQSAKAAIETVEGLAASVPAPAKCGELLSACALAKANLAVVDYLSYGTDINTTLNTLVDAAIMADEETAKEIGKMIDAINHTSLEATALTDLVRYRTQAGDYNEYLEHVRSVWNKFYDLEGTDPEVEREKLLAKLKFYGVDPYTQICSKDPVNLGNGNFIYDRTDLTIKALPTIRLKRFYNAQDEQEGGFGKGWLHTYEEKIKKDGTKFTHIKNDGGEEPFLKACEGIYRSALEPENTLEETKEGYLLKHPSAGSKIFRSDGKLLRAEDEAGKKIICSYNEKEQLEKVSTLTGETLSFSYNENGKITEIKDHTGRCVIYTYADNANLTKAIMTDGATYTYDYDESGKIISVTNPRGIQNVYNHYDDKGRVIRQDFPDGGSMTFCYDEEKKETILTERNDAKIIYRYDENKRHIATIDEAGITRYTYNKYNKKSSITDRRNNITKFLYDKKGNMTAVIDPMGNKTCFTYNAYSLPDVVKDAKGAKTYLTYNAKKKLTQFTDSLGNHTFISYDELGRITEVLQADGSKTCMNYDEKGNLTELLRPDGSSVRYEYDILNRPIASLDGNGNRMTYVYDTRDRIIEVTNPAGVKRTYQYNESGRMICMSDYDKQNTRVAYNALNRPISITDKEGNQTTYEYDLMWNLTKVQTPDGAIRRYIYDKMERLVEVVLPNGGIIRYTYDPDGNRTGVTDAEGNQTQYAFDASNRLIKITDAGGNETSYQYDKNNNLIKETNPLGNEKTYHYDANNRLLSQTDYLGNRTDYVRDCLGNVIEIHYPNGGVEKREYYKGGRLKCRTNPAGIKESYVYDGNGNIIERTAAGNQKYTYAYDCHNHLISACAPTGGIKKWEYDVMGRVTALIDENGNRTEYEYSPNGNLLVVTDALQNKAFYDYDVMGHLTLIKRTDEENRTEQKTEYLYDLMGLPVMVIDALGNKETYAYDKNGRMIQKTDRDGYVTGFAYNALGQTEQIDYADGKSVRYHYDALRHLEKVQDWNGEICIENDVMGRAIHVTDHNDREVSYTYGTMGERTSITYPDGNTVNYIYDEYVRLSQLQDGNGVVNYSYDELSRLTRKTFPNGAQTDYTYDSWGKIVGLLHTDKEGVLDRYIYGYDLVGNKTTIEKERRGLPEESGIYTYSYDSLSRLSEVNKDGQLLRAYEYDSFGNRVRMTEHNQVTTYTYNACNQLLTKTDAIGEEIFEYDKRGNLNIVIEDGMLMHKYVYGANNRLNWASNNHDEAATYLYNGLGYRISKVEGKTDNEKGMGFVNPEKNINYINDLTREYHNLLQKQENGQIQNYIWDKNVIGVSENDNYNYYFQDEMGSTIRLMDATGNLTEKYCYNEFGLNLKEEWNNQGSRQPFGFTGYQWDQIAGTYFAQAREYLPKGGRFGTEDWVKGTILFPNTINSYTYCRSNPQSYVDLNGKEVYYFYNPNTFDEIDDQFRMYKEIRSDIKELEKIYGTEVVLCPVSRRNTFTKYWDKMDEANVPIDAVVIYAHANADVVIAGSHFEYNWDKDVWESVKDVKVTSETINNLGEIEEKIDTVLILGCNAGLTEQDMGHSNLNIATVFAQREDVVRVIASDGSIAHSYINDSHHFEVVQSKSYHDDGTFDGFKVYYHGNEQNPIYVGMEFNNITDLINCEKE